MEKSKNIAVFVVIIVFIIIGFIFYIDYNSKKVKQETINEFKRKELLHTQVQEVLKQNKKNNEIEFFLKNINSLIVINPTIEHSGLFGRKTFINVENKSNYNVNEVIIKLNYLQGKVIIASEYIPLPSLNDNDMIKIEIPHHKCDSWEWYFYNIVCNDLDINYVNENI